ncbi:uncharacterized protein L201_003540 [Kwoniella dendrophila CBS 6074]|uniref:BZIP domain-containing protein n=1 Tax=Kwoniella dendrophila CBS 6074 TaxID=1295534 RepID=A0AAX4JTC8_9TREE
MSVAIPQARPMPTPTSSSSRPLATRPPTMLPKPSNSSQNQRVQPRPSAPLAQRPMAPRPSSSSTNANTPQIASRPPPQTVMKNNVSSSSKIQLPPKGTISSAPSPSSSSTPSATRPAMHSRNSSTASTATTSSNMNNNIAPLTPVAGKDTSSSAGKIFAKPSKEWVLPERAKPGRKVSVEEPDNKRQSQNRLSQRAHRARRTDYIQTLEERLRQYEANEIHSNVRLQEVARALKNDNERLKNELNSVKMQIMEFNGEKDVWELERRSFKDSIKQLKVEIDTLKMNGLRNMNDSKPATTTTIVRMEVDQNTIDSLVPGPSPSLARRQSLSHRHSYTRSNPSQQNIAIIQQQQHQQQQSKKDLVDCPICPNPDPDCPCQQGSTSSVTQTIKKDITLAQPSSCGLCHSTDECLCRVVVNQQEPEDIKPIITSPNMSSPTKSFKLMDDGCGLCAGGGFCACRAASEVPSNNSGSSGITKAVSIGNSSSSSITTTNIVRATSSASAVPLRLKSKSNANAKQSIWALNNVSTAPITKSPKTEAVCTGDPDNCDACRNDTFGQEFCRSLFDEPHPDATEGLEGNPTKKGCGNCNGPGGCMSIKSLLSPTVDQSSTSSGRPTTAATSSSSSKIITPRQKYHDDLDDEPQLLAPLQMACCGNPELCGGHNGTGCTGEIVLGGLNSNSDDSVIDNHIGLNLELDKPMVHLHVDHHHDDIDGSDHTKLRPDQAWKQLKAHPNAKFASLALLADVVARRTNVLGQMNNNNSPSPAPSSPLSLPSTTQDYNHSQSSHASSLPLLNNTNHSTFNHSHAHKRRAGGFDIETSAVREALKYLDKATPVGSPAPSDSQNQGIDERGSKRRRF